MRFPTIMFLGLDSHQVWGILPVRKSSALPNHYGMCGGAGFTMESNVVYQIA